MCKRSCVVIGNSSLTLQCADVLLNRGYQVSALVSTYLAAETWCYQHDIPRVRSPDVLFAQGDMVACDYLFSVVNPWILDARMLSCVKKMAINYHDSPLPHYAGLCATSWAILDNQPQHGISWHHMTPQIDTGDILKQVLFPIAPNETAFSLNCQCYEHALKSFQSLVTELHTTNLTAIKQNLSQRSYFGRSSKPKYIGFISWQQTSQSIDRLCRALDFGDYANPLASAKCMINHRVFAVKGVTLRNCSSQTAPGTVLDSCSQGVLVSTGTTDILLHQLISMDGQRHPCAKLFNALGIRRRDVLPEVTAVLKAECIATVNRIANNESFWVQRLNRMAHEKNSLLPTAVRVWGEGFTDKPYTTIPERFIQITSPQDTLGENATNVANVLLAALGIFFYRMNDNRKSWFKIQTPELSPQTANGVFPLMADAVPFVISCRDDMNFGEVVAAVRQESSLVSEKHTYLSDIFLRYPCLSSCENKQIILIIMNGDKRSPSAPIPSAAIIIYLSADGTCYRIVNNMKGITNPGEQYLFDQLHDTFSSFLIHLSKNIDKPIGELSIISQHDNTLTLDQWNQTRQNMTYPSSLYQYVDSQAQRTPNKIAIEYGRERLSFHGLRQKSERVAFSLRRQGVTRNTPVALYLAPGLDTLVAILGVLKAGGAYVPIDVNCPPQRLNFILADSQPLVMLTHHSTLLRFSNRVSVRMISMRHCYDVLPLQPVSPINTPEDLAYILYTSGSTGQPKGVAVTHRAVINHMQWMASRYFPKHSERYLQKTPYYFDASVWELFMPIVTGGVCVVAPENTYRQPAQLIQLIKQYHITVLQVVPSMLHELLSDPSFSSCQSLKHVFCGGEVLSAHTARRFLKTLTAPLHNLYGLTETTIDCTAYTYQPQDTDHGASLIGKPIANTQVYVLDAQKKPVPIGKIGELYVGGDCLSRGYINRSELNAACFIQNPFTPRKDAILFKTQDIVRWHPSGNLEYIGRKGRCIKLRGYRIELNAIEVTLCRHPAVKCCGVVMKQNAPQPPFLSAYLQHHPQTTPLRVSVLREHLLDYLPDYMIPKQFFVVDALPRLPSGKLDRQALDRSNAVLLEATVQKPLEPRTSVESVVHAIWVAAFNRHHIGIRDDFFNLGGDSLLAMQIISEIQKHFTVPIGMHALFKHGSIESLSTFIQEQLPFQAHSKNVTPVHKNTHIITLQKSGQQPPLFLIHPIGGGIFWFRLFPRYLSDRPLYAIQDPGLNTGELLFDRLEQMANYYIQSIRRVQPLPPYYIAGASFGSTLAIEIARQFNESGCAVKFIGLLDGWAYYPRLTTNQKQFLQLMEAQNKKLRVENHDLIGPVDDKFLESLQLHRQQLLMHYTLPVLEDSLTLFKASQLTHAFHYHAAANWWDACSTQPIVVHQVPGDHETMFYEPNVASLCHALTIHLNRTNIANSDTYLRSTRERHTPLS